MENTLKIIEVIGNQWLFLLVIFFIIIVIIKWKAIGLYISQINRIKGKIAGQEIEIEKSDEDGKSSSMVSTEVSGPIEKREEIEERFTIIGDVRRQYSDKNFDEGKKIFEEIQKTENDPVKKIRNNIFNFYMQYKFGLTSAAPDLEKYIEELGDISEVESGEFKSWGYYYLGLCYKETRDFKRALKTFNKAKDETKKPSRIADILGEISECLYEDGLKEEAINCLLEELENAENIAAKSRIYKSIAAFYEKEKNFVLKSLAFEKALEYAPDDFDLLFETAYAFSSAKISTLSLLHYKTLVSFNADNAASLNNLGINCEVLGMKFKSNSYLKNAFEKNSNIAGGNLANKYIGGGFYDEAKLILDKAKLADELEPRVGSAIALLSNEMKEEDEKENKFLDIARRQQRFFRTFASMAFSRRKSKLEFSGKWKDKKGVEIDISQDDTFIEAKWVARNQDKKYRIYGTFKNTLFADIKYEEPVYITSLETYEGYAYTNAGCDRLTILILKKDNDILELEFTKV